MSIPRFDRNITYEPKFNTHKLQKYMALFISKPALYADVEMVDYSFRQEVFFKKFHIFVEKYYTLNIEKDYDGIKYFSNLQLDKLGSANITGGCGKLSNSSRKQRLAEYHDRQNAIRDTMQYFSDKYKWTFTQTNDPRLFLGHTTIWKSPNIELLNKENWNWVINASYDDPTLTLPIPVSLDIDLVPLKIRNKVYQRWLKERSAKSNATIHQPIKKEEEEEEEKCNKHNETQPSPSIGVVIDAELGAMLNDW